MSTGHTFSGMHCADMYAPIPHGCSLSPSPPALGSGGLLLGSPRTQAHCAHWQMPLPGSLWLNEKTLLNDYVPTLRLGLHSKVPSSLPSPQSQCPLISSILFFIVDKVTMDIGPIIFLRQKLSIMQMKPKSWLLPWQCLVLHFQKHSRYFFSNLINFSKCMCMFYSDMRINSDQFLFLPLVSGKRVRNGELSWNYRLL